MFIISEIKQVFYAKEDIIWKDKWFQTNIAKTSGDNKIDNEKMIVFRFVIKSIE